MMNSGAKTTEEYLEALPDWQKANLEIFRNIIHHAIPDVSEEIKWGVPTFIKNKVIVFAMSAFKQHTKFNFIHNGAALDDAGKLFNNGLDSKKSRSIDLREGEAVDKKKLEQLVQQSVSTL